MRNNQVNTKKVIINSILILLVSILVIYYLLKNQFISSITDLLTVFSFKYLLLLIVLILLVSLESFIIYYNFQNINGEFTYRDGISSYLYGNLGSNITPAKSGHFPFMIYNYEKKGYGIDQSLGSITQNQLVYTSTMMIFYTVVFIFSSANCYQIVISDIIIELKWFSLIGMAINIFFSAFFIVCGFCKPVNNIVVKLFSKLLFFLRRIPSKEEYIEEQTKKMIVYREQVVYLIKHFHKASLSILAYFICVICYYGLPYIIYLLVVNGSFSFSEMVLFISMTQAMTYVTNIVPVPANTGVSEFAFLSVFANVISDKSKLTICMILYRLCICYILLIVDFIYFITTTVKDSKRSKVLINE